MNDFEKVINFIASRKTDTPTLYGWFHLTWLAVTFIACTVVFVMRKKITRTQVDLTLVVWGGALILLEVLKQLVVSFKNVDGEAVWQYAWWAFPFQFCSTPLYLALPAGFLRKGAIKDALYSFLASYAFMGGFVALVYPANMFTSSAFISAHTMLWHSSMVVILFMLLASGTVKPCKSAFLRATAVFVILTSLAIILNVIIGECAGAKGVNIFFIS
ncbi:MAG: YwaF family protein, partial [Clostridia bacterium]|nr:YwaF family protein [Clostridia bacterium]